MRFHQFLRFGIVVCALLIVGAAVGQYLSGVSVYANVTTYGIALLACAVLYRIARPARHPVETIVRLGIAYAILFAFLQRIVSLFFFPNTFGFSTPPEFSPRWVYTLPELHRAMLMYLAFTAAFLVGVRLAVRRRGDTHTAQPADASSPLLRTRRVVYVWTIAAFALIQTFTIVFNWRMGSAVAWQFGWVMRLLPVSLLTWAMVILFFKHHDALTRRERAFTVGFLALLVLASLAQGSRSGLVTFVGTLLFGALVVYGNFHIPRRLVVWLAVAVVFLGPLFWGIGSAVRSHGFAGGRESFRWNDVLLISRRFGVSTDNFIIVTSGRWDHDTASRYMTLRNIVNTSINAVVPGDVLTVPWKGFSLANLWMWLAWGEATWRQIPLHGEGWYASSQLLIMYGLPVALALVGCWGYLATRALAWCWRRGTTLSLLIASQLFTTFVIEFSAGANLDSAIISLLSSTGYIVLLALSVQFLFAVSRVIQARSVAPRYA
jgi:hypothetical protein